MPARAPRASRRRSPSRLLWSCELLPSNPWYRYSRYRTTGPVYLRILRRQDIGRSGRRPSILVGCEDASGRASLSPMHPAGAGSVRLETLVADWLSALVVAERAVRSSADLLPRAEVDERLRRVGADRSAVARELEEIAHGQRGALLLARCLRRSDIDIRLLGLPKDVSACIFDLDGALTTSAVAHCNAWGTTLDPFLLARSDRLRQEFVPFDPARDYEAYLAGRPRLAGLRTFLASRGIALPDGEPADPPGAESVYGLANRKNVVLRHYVEQKGMEAFDGSRAFLELARVVGARRAVVSARANTGLVLQRAGIDDLVEEQVDGTVLEPGSVRPKPAPDMLVIACARLGVEPAEAAAFETAPAGITAARAAGIRAVVAVARDGDTAAF